MSEVASIVKAASSLFKFAPIVVRPFRIAKMAEAILAARGFEVSRSELRKILRSGGVRKSMLTWGAGEPTQQLIASRMRPGRLDASEISAVAQVLLEAHAVYDTTNSARYAQLGTGDAIQKTEKALLGALTSFRTDDARFGLHVAKLPKAFARQAVTLKDDWPDLARFLGEYVASDDLSAFFSQWVSQSEMSQAPGRALAFLGELAEAHGFVVSANQMYEKALSAGAQPEGYWAVRRVQCIEHASDQDRIALLSAADPHPWASLAISQLRKDIADDDVDRELRRWRASLQVTSERSYIRVVEARVARAAGRLDEARKIGWGAWEEDDNLDAAEISIEAALAQDATGDLRLRSAALERILRTGLEVRDRARLLRLPSGGLVRQMIVAALLLQDVDRAKSLGQSAPVGEATPEEAAHQAVVSEMALLFARGGDVEATVELLSKMTSAGTRADVLATLNEAHGYISAAVVLWHMALAARPDISRTSQLCMMLAQFGVRHPSIEKVHNLAPEVADDIDLTANLARGSGDALALARRDALQNPRVAFSLLQFYQRNGDEHAVDALATQLARQTGDPDLWLTAARVSQRATRWPEAIKRAESAIARASESWGGMGNAYAIVVEGHSRQGSWSEAAVAAEELYARVPGNETALWWIVQCRTSAGQLRKAYEVWDKEGRPDPASPDQALNLLHLRQRIGSEVFGLAEALRLVGRWPSEERIHAAVVATFAGEVHEGEESGDFSSFLQGYFDRFPESTLVRRITVDDGDLLHSLGAALGPAPDLTGLERAVREGRLPLGALQAATGRSFATINAAWFASPRLSAALDMNDEVATVDLALDAPVVIDTTAFFALSLFDDRSSAILYSILSAPYVVLAQAVDAAEAEFDLPARDTMVPNVGPGPDWIQRRAEESELARQGDLQRKIAQWFARPEQVHHSVTAFKDESDNAGSSAAGDAWLVAVDRAVIGGDIVWIDDSVMRAIALERGARAFGTIALIEWAARAGRISDAERDLLEAQLLSAGFSGVPFRPRTFALGLQLDGQQPKGVAAGLLIDEPHNVDEKLGAILRALESRIDDPGSLQGWAYAVSMWLRRISGPSARDNLILFSLVLVRQPWVTPSVFGAIVRGLIAGGSSGDESEFVVEACSRYCRELSESIGAKFAYSTVRHLVDEIPEGLQLRVSAALLKA